MEHTSLLRKVPTATEWMAEQGMLAALDESSLTDALAAYFATFSISLPLFDEYGSPTMPPDEHIVDAFARTWLTSVSDGADPRADYGTVAVVPGRPECDICLWPAARYESYVGPERDPMSLCLRCAMSKADPLLGVGHSVMLLAPGDLPAPVLRAVLPYVPQGARPSWTRTPRGDGWDGFRRWGFSGPESDGRLYAVVGNFQLGVGLGPLDSIMLLARHTSARIAYAPGGDEHLGPRGLDELDARAFLLHVLDRDVSIRERAAHAAHFAVPGPERDGRAEAALEHGGAPWLRLGDGYVCEGADLEISRDAAACSADPSLVERLASEHQELAVRRAAAANSALSGDQLARIASGGDIELFDVLLARTDLPAASTSQIVDELLLAGSLRRHAIHLALKRPDFPEARLKAVVERVMQEGTTARIELAYAAHGAPRERRDTVHRQLVLAARKISSTRRLLDAIIGSDAVSPECAVANEERKVRDLIAWYLDDPAAGASEGGDNRAEQATLEW